MLSTSRTSTRQKQFLNETSPVEPWTDLVAAIEPVHPKADGLGYRPVGVDRPLRLHCLQQWFNLSNPAVEEALYNLRAGSRGDDDLQVSVSLRNPSVRSTAFCEDGEYLTK